MFFPLSKSLNLHELLGYKNDEIFLLQVVKSLTKSVIRKVVKLN